LRAHRAECGALDGPVRWKRERGASTVGVVTNHGYVVAVPHETEAEGLKSCDDPGSRRVDRKLGGHPAMVASATKASSTGDSGAKASAPNVSMWNSIAERTSARAAS